MLPAPEPDAVTAPVVLTSIALAPSAITPAKAPTSYTPLTFPASFKSSTTMVGAVPNAEVYPKVPKNPAGTADDVSVTVYPEMVFPCPKRLPSKFHGVQA